MKRTIHALALAATGLALVLWATPAAAQHEGHDAKQHGEHADHDAHKAMMEQPADDQATEIEGGLNIPDVTVRTQDGEEKSFYSDLVAGRTVAINFVFTTCTTICPPMGANFGRLQDELGERLGRDVHLISVSVDPTTDTPQRLKAWGAKFGARDGWTLVTGEQQTVERLLKALQVFNADINEHSPVVLIGNDAAGEWTRAYGLAGPKKLEEIVTRVEHAGDPAAHLAHGGGE
jgi:protein SCO1/2